MRHDCKGDEPENGDISPRRPSGYIAIVDTAADSISIVDRMGNVRRFTGVMRDVALRGFRAHELQEAAAATREALAAAATAGRAKSEFLAVMSHELRTPLTTVNGFIDLLAHTAGLTREQRRYVQLVGTASEALLTVIDDILEFSKVESGRLKLEPRAFSPSALVHDTLEIRRGCAKCCSTFSTMPSNSPNRVRLQSKHRRNLRPTAANAFAFP
jgi:signal transduction histidine kinase